MDYYTKCIASKEEWEMVDVYADEGLTGMETQHRDEFNRMIADCRDGKIDRILVKSISRFARNQEDYTLTAQGIGCIKKSRTGGTDRRFGMNNTSFRFYASASCGAYSTMSTENSPPSVRSAMVPS